MIFDSQNCQTIYLKSLKHKKKNDESWTLFWNALLHKHHTTRKNQHHAL